MTTAKQHGVGDKWGLFSSYIPQVRAAWHVRGMRADLLCKGEAVRCLGCSLLVCSFGMPFAQPVPVKARLLPYTITLWCSNLRGRQRVRWPVLRHIHVPRSPLPCILDVPACSALATSAQPTTGTWRWHRGSSRTAASA